MRINTLTAGPALRYFLAESGYEEPNFPLRATWPIFLRFLTEPADAADMPSFQVRWTDEDAGTDLLVVGCVRQLTDDAGGYGSVTRTVALEFLYELAREERTRVAPVEVWAGDFPTLEAFAAAVEALPIFGQACASPAASANVVVEEFGPEETVDAA